MNQQRSEYSTKLYALELINGGHCAIMGHSLIRCCGNDLCSSRVIQRIVGVPWSMTPYSHHKENTDVYKQNVRKKVKYGDLKKVK